MKESALSCLAFALLHRLSCPLQPLGSGSLAGWGHGVQGPAMGNAGSSDVGGPESKSLTEASRVLS